MQHHHNNGKRRFSTSERAVLYVAADGRCESCGVELAPGWHADHRTPWSKGGPTELENGSALCPDCNLRKGDRMSALRVWQSEALDRYMRENRRDFLAVACPGSGKTFWALTVAKSLKVAGQIDRIIVVTPSDALRTQWSNNTSTGLQLRPYEMREPRVDKRGYDGIVTTYQALATGMSAGVIQRDVDDRTLVILDEIHHAADNTAFGVNLRRTFERAGRRLLLTGTPWRTDAREVMPFVTADEFTRELNVDYSYDYARAVSDNVCRPIEFAVVVGAGEFRRDDVVSSIDMRVDSDLDDSDESAATLALLSAEGDWMADVVSKAHADLMSIRSEIPDAAGLIVAKDKDHAQRVQRLLRRVSGITAPVIVSGEDSGDSAAAKRAIETFRVSSDPWVIAVRMIAEGVDIPRLMVGVYATTITTAMFFNQVVGRFVRVRSGERVTAKLYVPPRREIWLHVERIRQQLVQVINDDEKLTRCLPGGGGGQPESDLLILGSTSDGLDRVRTFDGDLDGNEVENMRRVFSEYNIPTHYASNAVAAGLSKSVPTIPEPVEPRHQREKRLRGEIQRLTGRVAHHCYGDHMAAKDVAYDLRRLGFPPRKDMTIEQLESVKVILAGCLAEGVRVSDFEGAA